MTRQPIRVRFAALAAALGVVAALSPLPDRVTDRGVYEKTAADVIVRDCSDLHCFRVLVPWILGRIPGPSVPKWKAYAALANAAAAVAVFALTVALGGTARAALFASLLSSFGFGALYTLHDSYTSDPLMFAAGPFLMSELVAGRFALAGVCASIGVLAKEFAAAPIYLFGIFAALGRDWIASARAFVAANLALIVWIIFVMTMVLRFNYWLGGSDSANVTGGSWLLPWLERQSPRGVATAMFNEFGALYVLVPAGLWLAPAAWRRLALAAVPIALVLGYVQQPDRAFWNLHFIVTPLAALVLEQSPAAVAWATVACFAIGNLRLGAQLPIAPLAKVAVAASLVLAAWADVASLRSAASIRTQTVS